MPNRFNDVNLGNEQMWVKFDSSIIGLTGRIIYKFKCSCKPFIRQSNGKFYVADLDEKYRLNHFKLLSDKQKKHIIAIELGKQNHPHKDPKTGNVCMGNLKGIRIAQDVIRKLIWCLLTYNENDCYELPTSCKGKSLNETYGGNTCLTF
jgi:hypothetical protein